MQLKFKLQGQRLTRTDRLCPVADSKNLLGAEFEFSHQWSGCQKTAIFKDADGTAYSVVLSDDKCAVPYEVTGGEFYVSVFGVKNEMRITSDEISVFVEVSGYAEGETPQEPTQTVYEQILSRIGESEAAISDELNTSVQMLSAEIQSIDKKFSTEVQSIDDKLSKEVQTIDNKFSTEIQESEGRFSDGLENLKNQLTQSIDTHKADFDKHISADERELWNTVSDKAERTDVEALQVRMSNAQEALLTKADKTEVDTLQEQMGDIEMVLDEIIAIQNALMGNYTYDGIMPPVVGGDAV